MRQTVDRLAGRGKGLPSYQTLGDSIEVGPHRQRNAGDTVIFQFIEAGLATADFIDAVVVVLDGVVAELDVVVLALEAAPLVVDAAGLAAPPQPAASAPQANSAAVCTNSLRVIGHPCEFETAVPGM